MFEQPGEPPEVDTIVEAGAYIMGRNMFGPGRGELELDRTGRWGPERPITHRYSCSPTTEGRRAREPCVVHACHDDHRCTVTATTGPSSASRWY